MINIEKIRSDFPILNKNKEKKFIYFDSAATSLKPQSVINASSYYYEHESANSHRGDYDIAFNVDKKVDEVREKVAKFINASKEEIVFTSGTSMSINTIAFGYGFKFLKEGDEILITEAEHASNVLPWFKIAELTKAVIKYIPLNSEGKLLPENLRKVITNKTKIVAVAHVTNVLGFKIDIKEIAKIAHEYNALCIVDGAQSVPHCKIDVKECDIDFLSFSAHKMCGPTGIGAFYGKYELLEKMDPLMTGGGDNARFDMCGSVALLEPPMKFESGTLNLAGIYGFGAAIDYLNNIGLDNIEKYESELRKYCVEKLKTLQKVIIYNENADCGIVTINVKDVFCQDESSYLNSKGICVRSGEHCAKILRDFLKVIGTVRISFYFYNTKEEVDYLYECLKEGGNFLDAYFN